MTRSRARYMEWAKARPRPRHDLAGSNLAACTLADLPGARETVDLAGESPNGYAPLVEAIAEHAGLPAGRIATAGGCSGANFLAMAAVLDSGDEVLVESPGYDPLPAAAAMLGASVRTFERRFEEAYAIDPERIAAGIGPRTRLVVVTNPHNPSGVLAPRRQIQELAALADRTGVLVLVDEVYLETVFEGRPPPAATLSERMISTNSLTKAYGLASLRCGWTIASRQLTESIRRARDVVDVWAPIPADRISVVAMRNLSALSQRTRRIVETNSALVRDFLERRPEIECAPFASTLAFPRLRGVADASAFAERLFSESGTAVVPGRFFDSPSHFRISFGGPTEMVEKGLAAIAELLDRGGGGFA